MLILIRENASHLRHSEDEDKDKPKKRGGKEKKRRCAGSQKRAITTRFVPIPVLHGTAQILRTIAQNISSRKISVLEQGGYYDQSEP